MMFLGYPNRIFPIFVLLADVQSRKACLVFSRKNNHSSSKERKNHRMKSIRLEYYNHPRKIELLPPGGCSTRDDGRSVRTFPQFMLFPLAKVLLETTKERLEFEFELSTLLFDFCESSPSLAASPTICCMFGKLISPFSPPSLQLRLMELLPPYLQKKS